MESLFARLSKGSTAQLAKVAAQQIQQNFMASLSSSDKSYTAEELRRSPNRVIFPSTLGKLQSSNIEPFRIYSPEQLGAELCSDDTSVFHIESIWVEFAVYFKQRSSPKHELLLFKLKDSENPTVSNYILLDRVLQSPSSSPVAYKRKLLSFGCAKTAFNPFYGDACDRFYVSNTGSFQSILQQWGRGSYEALETIEFSDSSPFQLDQLLALVQTTSNKCTNYHVQERNCYWFASSVWRGMSMLSSGRIKRRTLKKGRGEFFNLDLTGKDSLEDILCGYPDNLKNLHFNMLERQADVASHKVMKQRARRKCLSLNLAVL